ncbi:MAG: NADH-ubiquinone oxidoreductase-F iron-sulfur binding region domain-containing protein [Candidatus Margulisiibacteriota bacterium]
MNNQNIANFKCCVQCWHTEDKKCPDFIHCLLDGPLCHQGEKCRDEKKALIKSATGQGAVRPVIYVGMGTCGIGAGADKTLKKINEYIQQNNIDAEVVAVGCVGYCAAEPIVDIHMPGHARLSFQEVTEDKVSDLLQAVLNGDIPKDLLIGQYTDNDGAPYSDVPLISEHPFFQKQTRRVLVNCGIINPESIEEYIARGGYRAYAGLIKNVTRAECCEMVVQSGLRGRGGGGFPTGKKWQFALNTPSEQKYIICNADEGDPGAFMDRAVIEGDPHRVLEGIAIAAYAIGASKAYIYIRAEYPLAIKRLETAIKSAAEMGLIGANILDSGIDLTVIIKKGAGAFVCGEETALIHSIEGKRGMPRPRPPYPAASGLNSHPTVINNVETLANIPDIIKNGPQWFNALGTANSKGTKVFALSGKLSRTGLAEVEMGMALRDIVYGIGGGPLDGKKIKAIQIGGPSGGCIPEQNIDISVDYDSLKAAGAMIGSGGLVVMDNDNCMVDVAKYFMEFIQKESCGKCIPCREGTKRMLEILKSITRPVKNDNDNDALQRFKGIIYLQKLAGVIQDTSLCGLGQTAPNPVLSTLRWFRDEYEAHVYERKCPAKACAEMLVYEVDQELCRGCTLCAKKCPADAVVGTPKKAHYILTEKCIGCGNCVRVCPFGAVIIK